MCYLESVRLGNVAVLVVVVACGSSATAPDASAPSDASTADTSSSDGAPTKTDASSDATSSSDAPVGKSCNGCPPPVACASCFVPTPEMRWQYQLQGDPDTTISSAPYTGGSAVTPDVFDVDLYASDGTTPDATGVTALHQLGRHAICYVDAGTYENFRPDASDYTTFDSSCGGCLLGQNNGWPGEQWLNVNDDKGQRTFILQELGKRLDKCVAAGFDGVEFDNVDGYANTTGFTISAATQEYFDASIANLAHQKNLSVALKNDVDQAADLEPYFDFTVNEQCWEYQECDSLASFQSASKAVFNVEYNLQTSQFCPQANTAGVVSILKTLDLDPTPWTPCR